MAEGVGTRAIAGRRRAAVVAASLAAACAIAAPASASYRLPLYQSVAPVQVLCASLAEWAADPLAHQIPDEAGYTSLDGDDRIVLAPRMCLGLLLLAVDPAGTYDALNERPGFPVAFLEAQAALALGHELAHATLRGDDETAAACFARVQAPRIFALAGASGARLKTLTAQIDAPTACCRRSTAPATASCSM